MVEQEAVNFEVVGSNPTGRARKMFENPSGLRTFFCFRRMRMPQARRCRGGVARIASRQERVTECYRENP